MVLSAEQGLRRLVEGNKRFVSGKARFPTVCKETLAALAKGQQPYAMILGCADSRVPPELIFDANFGELFIVRVAGNVISPEIMGSIQYAGTHLRTPLFVVLGHEGCGAVKAAIDYKSNGTRHHSHIQILVNNIVPGLPKVDDQLSEKEQLSRAVEANVRWAMKQLLATPEGKKAAREGQKKLVGAVFGIDTGRVRFLDNAE
ncbi:MAG TPA: carbonic anhydrase [Candidatus Eremiobacteraceae bacterium]|nr:carbonic anhydrase [Candidatus Eremiobacteraceae bacterium]